MTVANTTYKTEFNGHLIKGPARETTVFSGLSYKELSEVQNVRYLPYSNLKTDQQKLARIELISEDVIAAAKNNRTVSDIVRAKNASYYVVNTILANAGVVATKHPNLIGLDDKAKFEIREVVCDGGNILEFSKKTGHSEATIYKYIKDYFGTPDIVKMRTYEKFMHFNKLISDGMITYKAVRQCGMSSSTHYKWIQKSSKDIAKIAQEYNVFMAAKREHKIETIANAIADKMVLEVSKKYGIPEAAASINVTVVPEDEIWIRARYLFRKKMGTAEEIKRNEIVKHQVIYKSL